MSEAGTQKSPARARNSNWKGKERVKMNSNWLGQRGRVI
jgi:hypothetical protein